MKLLNHNDYIRLIRDSKILSADGYGDKVIQLRNGQILKLFRSKRLISSAILFPYANRFKLNAEKLIRTGFPSVTDVRVFTIPSLKRTAILYKPLEGTTLREHLKQTGITKNLSVSLAAFISRVHANGIYFRSIHFGNIIVITQNNFGLIDVADMRILKKPLGVKRRLRNFNHFARYPEDVQRLKPQLNEFLENYIAKSHLPKNKRQKFITNLFEIFQSSP